MSTQVNTTTDDRHKLTSYTVKYNDGKETVVTLPTPLGSKWADIRLENVYIFEYDIPGEGRQEGELRCTQRDCSNGEPSDLMNALRHPDIAPVPFFIDRGDDADFKLPDEVVDRCITDPAWKRFADRIILDYSIVPHWTINFKNPDVAQTRKQMPLPDFSHHLLEDPDIESLVFVFDASRSKFHGIAMSAITVIMRGLWGLQNEDL